MQSRNEAGLKTILFVLGITIVGAALQATAKEVAERPSPQEAKGTPNPGGARIKSYDEVIPRSSKAQQGVFIVHTVDDRVYYEIPPSELDQDFLLVTRVERKSLTTIFSADVPRSVVRWQRFGNQVLLRSTSYSIVADDTLPVAASVRNANEPSIIMAFPIATLGLGDAPIIDVTSLFAGDVPEVNQSPLLRDLNGSGPRKTGSFDRSRSFIERVTSYPTNIEVEATHTYAATGGAPSVTLSIHYSMVKLPESPMRPRLFDKRVGYAWTGLTDQTDRKDYGGADEDASRRRYIARWRLDKADPSAALSEPKKPILYYLDPAIPAKWRPWIRRGVEDWQHAFEAAGFKNAIIVKDPPTVQEDPNWSPDDARYSMVRWLVAEKYLPAGTWPISDPRTGETLNGNIYLSQDQIESLQKLGFITLNPLDPRARHLPLSDELLGELLQRKVEYSVGIAVGLRQSTKAGSYYPVRKLRDPEWLHTMGFEPGIMNDPFIDFIAQPEDAIPVQDLLARLGPYDKWTIHWGYAPIAGADSPQAEKPTLDRWAREQDSTPWLRWVETPSRRYLLDPGMEQHYPGNGDPVYSIDLEIKNLRRVMATLVRDTSRPGEPYDDLREVYERILTNWGYGLESVARVVGGIDVREKYAGQEGVLYAPIPRERQSAAMHFLSEKAFQTREILFAVPPDVLDRLAPTGLDPVPPAGSLERVRAVQSSLLGVLLEDSRLVRLIEQEARDPLKAYRPVEFFAELHAGIWGELEETSPKIDPYRRNLQRSYIEILIQKTQTPNDPDNIRPYFYTELKRVATELKNALPKIVDPETQSHLDFSIYQIQDALAPGSQRQASHPD